MFAALLFASGSALAQAPVCTTGTQTSGALYEYCVPGGAPAPSTLVVYAHGYIFPQFPLTLPSQDGGGASVLGLAVSQGYAYAASSYYANGLVLPDLVTDDLLEVIDLYKAEYGDPENIYLVGFSNGALFSTVALEREPDTFDGALASCGPLGSYAQQVDYLADVYTVFDFFFPTALDDLFGVEAGGPGTINPAFQAALFAAASEAGVSPRDFLSGALAGILADPANTAQTGGLLGVIAATPAIQAAFTTSTEGVTTVITAIVFNVFGSNNVTVVIGGNPYDNTATVYASPFGAAFDTVLNAGIARYVGDEDASARVMEEFETTGRLLDPIVALHTTRDPVVPFWQSQIYAEEVRNSLFLEVQPIDRYGHCAFAPAEIAMGFQDLLGVKLPGCDYRMLADAAGPLTLGSDGGRLVFKFGIDNSMNAEPAMPDVWLTVSDSEGNVVYTRRPRTPTIGAGRLYGARLGQRVPASFPDGTYTITIYAGDYNADMPMASEFCAFETFTFTKGDISDRPLALAKNGLAELPAFDLEEMGQTAVTGESVTVAPNPSTGMARFAFALAQDGPVSLDVFDVQGRHIATLADGVQMEAGAHEIGLAEALAPGVYVWRLALGDRLETGRLTVVR